MDGMAPQDSLTTSTVTQEDLDEHVEEIDDDLRYEVPPYRVH